MQIIVLHSVGKPAGIFTALNAIGLRLDSL